MSNYLELAHKFADLTPRQRVLSLNILAHILPTKGLDFDKEEEDSLERTIDILKNALSIQHYTGPSEELLLSKVALLDNNIEEAIAEEAESPGSTYVNPDNEKIGEEVESPDKVKPTYHQHKQADVPVQNGDYPNEMDWY